MNHHFAHACHRPSRRRGPGPTARRAAKVLAATHLGLLLFSAAPVPAEVAATPRAAPAADATEAAAADPRAAALLAYSAAVRRHLQPDPVLAATYLAFWNGLRTAQPDSIPGAGQALGSEHLAGIARSVGAIARTLQQRHPKTTAGTAFTEALGTTLLVMGEQQRSDQRGAKRPPAPAEPPPESLLRSLDRDIAPRVLVNGRYEYADGLLADPDLGIGAEVWLRCRPSPSCVELHDRLFAAAMGGVSLAAEEPERFARDPDLRPLLSAPLVEQAIRSLSLAMTQPAGARMSAVRTLARDYWQEIARQVDAGSAASSGGSEAAPAEIDLLLDLGRSAAQVAGAERLASSFTIMRQPLIEFSRLRTQGVASGLLAAGSGMGLLFAGIQALSLFELPEDATAVTPGAPPALDQLIRTLHQSNYRQFIGLRSEALLGGSAIDARIASLGVTLEVIRDDVARIETAQRSRVRADFLAEDARRWAAFEADNDRCFSLRHRDAHSGRLRGTEFRRCEERFLQGATRRAQYATRSSDFTLDARFLAPLDARFPFHAHYPLLLGLAGMDTGGALTLVDPFEWQQHSAALLRLYQLNPARVEEYAPRTEVLHALRGPGERIHAALRDLTVDPQTRQIRLPLHEQAIAEYFQALDALLGRLRTLDDPDADRYGKRLTVDLSQPLPEGRRLSAIETLLIHDSSTDAGGLALCAEAPDAAFAAPRGTLDTRKRRLFGTPPVSAEELDAAWNRERVATLGLQPREPAALVPRPLLWASLGGLGRVDICLARLRPETVEFTRSHASLRDHRRGSVRLSARIEVRFTPAPATAEALSLAPAAPLTIAAYEAERSCSFGYREDANGCSRAACLLALAPGIWSAEATSSLNGEHCEGAPLASMPDTRNLLETDPALAAVVQQIEALYWQRRAARTARLQADALRSSEFDNATALYLRNHALAAVTLGIWTDASEPLAPLYADGGGLAPHDIVRALVEERRDLAALRAELAAKHRTVLTRLAQRASQQLSAVDRLPHLRRLQETLSRIDLLLAAYQPPAN